MSAMCLSVRRDLSACLQGCSSRSSIQASAEKKPVELKHSTFIFYSLWYRWWLCHVIELTGDFRKVMEPFTASCLVSGLQLAHWGIPPGCTCECKSSNPISRKLWYWGGNLSPHFVWVWGLGLTQTYVCVTSFWTLRILGN